jgi:diguanylate cyclase (GGDEF)-like protein
MVAGASSEHHVSGVYTKMLMEFLVETLSADTVHELLEAAGESRPLAELADITSWSSYSQFRRLLEARARLDAATLYERTDVLAAWMRHWDLTKSAQTVGSPGELIAGGSESNPLLPIRHYDKKEVASNEWTIREWFDDGYDPFPEFCDFITIQYALIPVVFGLPPGEVIEETCQCNGDSACTFRISWQTNETDAQRAEQFRARAELFELRFSQIQEMVTDVASNQRIEEILQGFVGSSLRTTVGAGSALLVLEPRDWSPRKVYFEGLSESEAESVADDIVSERARSDEFMAVQVASARRHYGILAVDERGGVFSALSTTTLETFARLAATALDTAEAIEEARHQANTAQVLLDLATSLNEIVDTQEMTERVARAVPGVIDCDRAAVFLGTGNYEEVGQNELRLVASSGYPDDAVEMLRSQPPRSTSHSDAVNGFGVVRSSHSDVGTVASLSAPISIAGQVMGYIVAGVTSNPERLTLTPRVAERLKGLAAQVSIAISNSRLVDRIRFQAVHDGLTGLPNRVLIIDRAEQMLNRARRSDVQVAALFIDLDGFKDVNDTLGHGVGDQLLQAVAERLSVTMRGTDSIGRLGGDEFIVLVDGSTMDVGPELVAERLLTVLRAGFELPGVTTGELTLTASIGIATGLRDSATELLRDADIALYAAKAAGKDCYVEFRSEMQTAVQERHLLEMDLRDALRKDQFWLAYQPIFSLARGNATGVEALLRWNHPDKGLTPPDRFIPVLEESGMIGEIGRWVLHQACGQGARWHERGLQLDVAVNVSGRQLEHDQLVDDVREALSSSGFPASSLTIEITETAIMKNVSAVVRRLRALKDIGVRIAIDDFGTGYSSLAYLQQFPVDMLKIDRSFIASMADSPESGALIHTLVQLGKTLGLETLAEGIEESGQRTQLEREQCDSGQGFLYARPLSADGVESFLSDHIRCGRKGLEPVDKDSVPSS